MNKLDVVKMFKTAKTVMQKHSPEILTGIGIAGMITTTVLAVKATPKALKAIEEKKVEVYNELDPSEVPANGLPETVKLKPEEVIKATWKCYIPAAVTCVASVACLIGSNRISDKRQAALTAAYELSQSAIADFAKYKEKVIETIGEEKEKVVREAVAQERYDKHVDNTSNKPAVKNDIYHTDGGNDLMYDVLGEREFYGSSLAVEQALVRLNNNLRREMTVSLNDFYDELGLPRMTYLGDSVGWYVNKVDEIEPHFESYISKDGKPGIQVDFLIRPDYDYNNYR